MKSPLTTAIATPVLVALFIVLSLLSSCGSGNQTDPCGSGEAVTVDSNLYCVYNQELIIEGFSCPEATPHPFTHPSDGHVVCSGDPNPSQQDLDRALDNAESVGPVTPTDDSWEFGETNIGTIDDGTADAGTADSDFVGMTTADASGTDTANTDGGTDAANPDSPAVLGTFSAGDPIPDVEGGPLMRLGEERHSITFDTPVRFTAVANEASLAENIIMELTDEQDTILADGGPFPGPVQTWENVALDPGTYIIIVTLDTLGSIDGYTIQLSTSAQ